MAFKIPRFDRSIPLVTDTFTPTITFHQWWDTVARKLEEAIASIQSNVAAIQAALNAATAAQAAAVVAQTAATTAQTAVDNLELGVIDITLRTDPVRTFLSDN